MGHKITAFRLDGSKDGVTISALSQSPRGTRIMVGSKKVVSDRKDKAAFIVAVESAVTALIEDQK